MTNLSQFVLTSPYLVWGPLVTVVSVFMVLMAVFGVQVARRGLPHNPRVKGLGNAVMSQFFLEYFYWLQRPVGPLAVKLRIHPDVLSWTALLLQFAAALALSQNAVALGGWLLMVGASCDSLDGTVARARGMASESGEVLDSVLDRWAEMSLFFGLAWLYRSWAPGFVLALWASAGGMMVSYTRAKGEGLKLNARMGVMNRHERMAYLITATIVTAVVDRLWPRLDSPHHVLIVVVLGLIAVLGTATAMRRTAFLRAELRKPR